jgi:hypothetical protein
MASEADHTLHVAGEGVVDDTKIASGMESDVLVTSSCSNATTEKMVNKDTPMLSDYWKKSMVSKADCSASHAIGWLGGGL